MALILLVLLYYLSCLLIWQFVGYPLVMGVIAVRANPNKNKDYSYQPFVSIIVPTYNEAKVIKRRIENLVELGDPKEKPSVKLLNY